MRRPLQVGLLDGGLFGSISSGVPEPSTWAMMLVGFGAIGISIRRSRKSVLSQVA